MWAVFENAEIRSVHKREKRWLLRAAKEAVASGSRAPSPETLSADTLMPPPRRVLKSSSTSRHNTSMGADADWWHTPAPPQVLQTKVAPASRYRDAVLSSPRSTTGVRITGLPAYRLLEFRLPATGSGPEKYSTGRYKNTKTPKRVSTVPWKMMCLSQPETIRDPRIVASAAPRRTVVLRDSIIPHKSGEAQEGHPDTRINGLSSEFSQRLDSHASDIRELVDQ